MYLCMGMFVCEFSASFILLCRVSSIKFFRTRRRIIFSHWIPSCYRLQFDSVTGNTSAEKDKTLDLWNKLHKPDIMDASKVFTHLLCLVRPILYPLLIRLVRAKRRVQWSVSMEIQQAFSLTFVGNSFICIINAMLGGGPPAWRA